MAKNKLDLLLKIENEKEENLRMSYLQANQNLQANQQKLQGLNNFRLEYTQQLHEKVSRVYQVQGLVSTMLL